MTRFMVYVAFAFAMLAICAGSGCRYTTNNINPRSSLIAGDLYRSTYDGGSITVTITNDAGKRTDIARGLGEGANVSGLPGM